MAYISTQHRPSTSAPGDGSRTLTLTAAPPRQEDGESSNSPDDPSALGALRLRGASRAHRPRVAWDEDVVDNEGCGRKSSKICCIYHRPKRFDESSDEDSSDSDSDACDDRSHAHNHHARRPAASQRRDGDGAQAQARPNQGAAAAAAAVAVHRLADDSEPNAYEAIPSSSRKKGKRKAV